MTTDLHDRLHEALATAEIPSYNVTLSVRAVMHGRHARRRRVWSLTAGAVAVAATVAGVALVGSPPQPPTTPAPPAAIVPGLEEPGLPVDQLVLDLDGRKYFGSQSRVGGAYVYLSVQPSSSGEAGAVELTASQQPEPPAGADRLSASAVVVRGVGDRGGWTVTPAVAPDGTSTGQFVVVGLLPADARASIDVADGQSALEYESWQIRESDVVGQPDAWGYRRDAFVGEFWAPSLRGQVVQVDDPRVTVEVRAEIDGEWVELGR